MDAPYAFVTLVTSDHYLPGALAVAAALQDLHPSPAVPPEVPFQTLCLVTPENVDVSTIKLLRRAFDVVIGVEIIEQEDGKGLQLLGRPDLNLVLTKLHIFRLTQYTKLIFLDADVLPVRPMSHLFTIPHEFAAVPDVGWPDIFNSGVMVFNPGEDKFKELTELLKSKGSWDGGDQGVLNEWRGNDWHRLSFTYNTTPTAAYTYAPAYERFGSQISAIHFIGPNKPWASITYRPPGMKYSQLSDQSLNMQVQSYDYDSLVDRWFNVYDRHYRSDNYPQHANFEFTRYDSVWDTGSIFGTGAEMAPPPSTAPPGAVLGLDDLRKIAVEGISGYNATTQEPPRVGEYRSMPLEGRVDLMRQRKEPTPGKEEVRVEGVSRDQGGDQNLTPKQAFTVLEGGEIPAMKALPTPLPHEVPPVPHHKPLDLPTSSPSSSYRPSQPYEEQQYGAQQEQPYQPYDYYHDQPGSSYFPPTAGSVSDQSGGMPPLLGMHWAPHGDRRFLAQTVPYYQESDQSDDQQASIASWQPSWKVMQGHRTNTASLPTERHHRDSHRTLHPPLHPSHVRNGYVSPRGTHTPRGVQSPRGRHSPTQARHSPPPVSTHPSENGHHFVPHQQVHPSQSQHHVQPSHLPRVQGHPEHAQFFSHQESRTQRPASPPKLEWNPAIEPPPKTPPPPSAFPADTYFPNIWDQEPGPGYDVAHHAFPGYAHGPQSEAFFQPPPPSEIPEQLLREGQYESVIGRLHESSPGSPPAPPAPDRSKVHAIFPWEEKPRHAPRRVFPSSESPPPVANFIDEPAAPSPKLPSGVPSGPQVHSPPPPITLPFSLTYANAWDTVPSIQRYASKLVRPHHSVFQPPPPEHDEGWRRWDEERERVYQEKQDASSMDGDDEDEGDDDEDNNGQPARHDSESSKDRNQARRSRASSDASLPTGKGKKYRGRGVQTIPIETRNAGVQVNVWAEDVEAARKGKDSKPSRGTGMGTRQWPAMPTAAMLLPPVTFKIDPDQMASGTPTTTESLHAPVVPFPSKASPTGLRSPQTLGSPRTYSPPSVRSPRRVPSPPRIVSPKALSPPKVHSPRGPSSPKTVVSPRRLSGAQIPSRLSGSPKPPGSPSVGQSASSSPRQSPKLSKLSSPFSPPLHRVSSNDTMVTSSPSTTGPVETPEGTPIIGPLRKGGRVWDPARGVDVFKRTSEEVLARFLRSGSFEEDDGQRRHV